MKSEVSTVTKQAGEKKIALPRPTARKIRRPSGDDVGDLPLGGDTKDSRESIMRTRRQDIRAEFTRKIESARDVILEWPALGMQRFDIQSDPGRVQRICEGSSPADQWFVVVIRPDDSKELLPGIWIRCGGGGGRIGLFRDCH